MVQIIKSKKIHLVMVIALALVLGVSSMVGAVPAQYTEKTDMNFVSFNLGTLGKLMLPETWKVIDSYDVSTDHIYVFEDNTVGSMMRCISIEYFEGKQDPSFLANVLKDEIFEGIEGSVSNYRLLGPLASTAADTSVATVALWYYIEYIEEFYICTFLNANGGTYFIKIEDTTPQVKGYTAVYDKVIDSILNQPLGSGKAISSVINDLELYYY